MDSVPLLRRSSAGRNRFEKHCFCETVAHCGEKCGLAACRGNGKRMRGIGRACTRRPNETRLGQAGETHDPPMQGGTFNSSAHAPQMETTGYFGVLAFLFTGIPCQKGMTTKVKRATFEVNHMAYRSSLLEIIASQHPGLTISTYVEEESLVVCLRCEEAETRIAVPCQPFLTEVDAILGAIADRLVCCQHCDDESDPICHQDHQIMSNRLQRFLHPDIYEEFLANAPLIVGTGRSSGSPNRSPASR
jgi:hypothetical protein